MKTRLSLTQPMREKSALFAAIALCGLCAAGAAAEKQAKTLDYRLGATVKETYDSNVYLQDKKPDPAVVGAAPADKDSFVTSIIPSAGLTWRPAEGWTLSADYTPEITRYHAAPSENYDRHLVQIGLDGEASGVPIRQRNTIVVIDGDNEGLIFGGPGGAPAIGGVPLRNRRDQFVYKGNIRFTLSSGKWFVRPLATGYVHDFWTKQYLAAERPGYENYIDRAEGVGGVDVGREICENTRFYLSYRYGYQFQGNLRNIARHSDNHINRILFGLEGSPAPWLKLDILLGPDIRDMSYDPDPRVQDPHAVVYIDSHATITPTKNDAVTLTVVRYEQPAFASLTVYEDITYDVAWRHQCLPNLAMTAGFRAYIGDWRAPANREDWIYTPRVSFAYTVNKHLQLSAGYSYDWVDSAVADTAGREFTRHLVFLSGRCAY